MAEKTNDDTNGNERKYVASGIILPKKTGALPERLAIIFNGVTKLCETFSSVLEDASFCIGCCTIQSGCVIH